MRGRARTEIDVDAALEQLPEDLDDFGARHVQLASEGQALRDVLRAEHRLAHALLEEAQLRALGDGVADRQLNHVVAPGQERDHVVVDARALYVSAVLEVELLHLEVGLVQGPREQALAGLVLGEGEVGEDVLLLVLGEIPEDDDAVREDEGLGEGLSVGCYAAHGREGAVVRVVLRCFGVGTLFLRLLALIPARRGFLAASGRVLEAVHMLLASVAIGAAARVGEFVEVPLVVIPCFAALNLQVEERLAASGSSHHRPAANPAPISPCL